MKHSDKPFTHRVSKRCVIALHCSLGSGRQWTRLAEELGDGYHVIAPDLSGYGSNSARSLFPTTLADEVAQLSDQIDQTTGPIHLIGHSYGGAVAFKNGYRLSLRTPHSQPDSDRAGPADATARQCRGQAAARPVRGPRTQYLRRSMERHVDGSARQIPAVLEWLGP